MSMLSSNPASFDSITCSTNIHGKEHSIGNWKHHTIWVVTESTETFQRGWTSINTSKSQYRSGTTYLDQVWRQVRHQPYYKNYVICCALSLTDGSWWKLEQDLAHWVASVTLDEVWEYLWIFNLAYGCLCSIGQNLAIALKT